MASADPYRYENLTPVQLDAIRKSYADLGMRALPIDSGPENFDRLPLKQRQKLFGVVDQLVERGGDLSAGFKLPQNFGLAMPSTSTTTAASDLSALLGDSRGAAAPQRPAPEAPAAAAPAAAAPAAAAPAAAASDPGSLEIPPDVEALLEPQRSTSMGDTFAGPFRESVSTEEIDAISVPSTPGLGERATESMIGVAEGAVRYGAPMYAGVGAFNATLPGAVAAAPATGGFSLAVPPLAALGAYGGTYMIADKVADAAFPVPSRPDLAPYREGGITFSGIATGAPATLLVRAPSTVSTGLPVASRLYRMIDGMALLAQRNPKAFLGAEAITATATGLAGGSMVALYPGDEVKRFVAEFGMSVFTPGRLLFTTATTGYDAVRDAIRRARSTEGIDEVRANKLYGILNDALSRSKPIRDLEELGTPDSLQQAQFLRERYYKDLIKKLEKDFGELNPTAAQATGDPILSALELSLARGDSRFGSRIQNQSADALRAQQLIIKGMKDIGDPSTLTIAAKMEADLYDAMVLSRIGMAERESADAIAKLRVDSPGTRALMGNIVRENVEEALKEARDFEKVLWRRAWRETMTKRGGQFVPRTTVAKGTLLSFLETVSSMTPERYATMPFELRSIMGRLGITDYAIASYRRGKRTPEYMQTGQVPDEFLISEVITPPNPNAKPIYVPLGKKVEVEDLLNIRSDMLAWARDAAGGLNQRSPSDAAMYGKLADGILDDLSQIPGASYDQARAFSRALNDNFTRSYARDVTAVTRAGADRVPPEILVSRMFGADSDLTNLRMDQVQDAVGFFGQRYRALEEQLNLLRSQRATPSQLAVIQRQMDEIEPMANASSQRVSSITGAMERVVRMIGNDPTIVRTVNTEDGRQVLRVNSEALTRWMAKNDELISRFPALKADLQDANRAEIALRAIKDPNSAAGRQIRNQEAFADVLAAGERPNLAVSTALNSKTPVKSLGDLLTVARSGGAGAVQGLKASIFEWAYTRAGGTGERFSSKDFADNLFRPVAPGQPSVVNILRQNGMMTGAEVRNLATVIQTIRRMEQAKDNRAFLQNVLDGGDPLRTFAIRWVALHSGSAAIPQGAGSLAAASALSSFALDTFNNMPRLNALAALQEVTADPKLMAALLRKGATPEESANYLQRLRGELVKRGIIVPGFMMQRALVPTLNVVNPPRPELTADEARRYLQTNPVRRPPPPAPPTRGMPMRPPQGARATRDGSGGLR